MEPVNVTEFRELFEGLYLGTLFWDTELKVMLSWRPMEASKQAVPLLLLTT